MSANTIISKMSSPLVKLVERYLPDSYIFVLILTIIAFLAAMLYGDNTPAGVVEMWGDGFWNLLAFSMQMLLILATGYMVATTPLVRSLLNKIASFAKTPAQAIVLVSLVSLTACWLNWGMGLVIGAIFAKTLARQVKVDFRLLVASAYSGFLVWHGGFSGSVPLVIATENHNFVDQLGIVSTSDTIFASFNLIIVLALFIIIPFLNRSMLPKEENSIYVDNNINIDEVEVDATTKTPADFLENSRLLPYIIGFAGLVYIFMHFIINDNSLNLNIVNFILLFVAIILHQTPRKFLAHLGDAVKSGAGIVVQFPFYAGIMAIMVQSGLAEFVSSWFVSFSTEFSLPFWTFISAGIVNIFVPSGGGQWAVQAPIVIPAAIELGADLNKVAMSVAWGDAWTNMVQPFWALPLLGIAGLRAKDIMGFCFMHLVVSGIVISLGLTFL